MDMNRSNVYRYFQTLVDMGWLEHDTESPNKFQIGCKSLSIGNVFLENLEIRSVARPFLQELAKESCLAVHLGLLNNSSIVYVDKVESDSPIQMRSKIGMTAPAYCTAIGKALLSTLTPYQVTNLVGENYSQLTPNTLTTINDLLEDLKQIRERGYSIDLEENEKGIGCVAAVIFGHNNAVIGAVSISTLLQNLNPDAIDYYADKVMKCARMVSQGMGCSAIYSELSVCGSKG